MTRTNYAMPRFDGTAALESRPCARLVLIEGGCGKASGARASVPSARGRLSLGQSMALVVFAVALVGVLAVAGLVADGLSASATSRRIASLPEQELVVRDGDSLWGIADSLGVDGVSTADVVTWITERNGLDTALLVSGQRLVVPASAS